MDIIIFSGLSNMCGETESFPPQNPPVAGAYEYKYQTNTLEILKHPVGEEIFDGMLQGSDKKRGSLIPAFCRAYVKKTTRKVVAVHVARGASSIDQWQPDTTRYALLKKKVISAFQKIKENHTIEHVYFVWLQGESDALKQTTANNYLNQLVTLKSK